MIPIADDNSDRHLTPIVNYAFIGLNVFVFLVLQGMGKNLPFTYSYSTIPAEILVGTDIVTVPREVLDPETGQRKLLPGLGPTPIPVWLTLLTSMFMHGGWGHLLGNMLFLWVFGDNIENRMGHLRYLVFYLLCGVLASLCHVWVTAYANPANLQIPSLGASGAISGVMGGYLLLFPKRMVQVFVFRAIVMMPAVAVLGIWIGLQLFSGWMETWGIGIGGGGVAYAAHFGGFAFGLLLVKLFDRGQGYVVVRRGRKRFSR